MFIATVCPNSLNGLVQALVPPRSVSPLGSNRLTIREDREAAEEESNAQWECLHRWLARFPRPAKVPVVEMIRAYEEATGTRIGCD